MGKAGKQNSTAAKKLSQVVSPTNNYIDFLQTGTVERPATTTANQAETQKTSLK